MRAGYRQSLVQMGLNPENFEINDREPMWVACLNFLKWAFKPSPHRLTRREFRYLSMYMGRLFR
jgi:hypothetical protein